MGEVRGVGNGWEVQCVGGGINREKKIKHSHYLLKKASRHWYKSVWELPSVACTYVLLQQSVPCLSMYCTWLCILDNIHMTLYIYIISCESKYQQLLLPVYMS